MHSSTYTAFATLLVLMISSIGLAQEIKETPKKKSTVNKAFKEGIKLISTTPRDTVTNVKSTDPFISHSGKIIRNIYIERIGFEKSMYDSAKTVKERVTAVANALHTGSRGKIINNHLFIQPGDSIIPSKLGDNERYLRERDFVMDSRIVVMPTESIDSVDLMIVTRDVFSLGGGAGGSATAPLFRIFDANVDGRGQRIEYSILIDSERTPHVGHELLYRKSSVFGSLADVELGFTQLNTGISVGDETEYALLTRVTRPLASPYARLAGGLEVSRNWSENVYSRPDSLFLKYRYSVFDSWLGYNIGINRVATNRNRLFFATRYFNGNYLDQPEQLEYAEERQYNDVHGVLSEFTFYRQDFYKTRFIYGFGQTEDVPYGISAGFVAGYLREVNFTRPYSAIRLNYSQASKKGNFYRFTLQAGSYLRDRELEDAVVQVGAAYFTRLLNINRYRIRNSVSTTATNIFAVRIIDPLHLNRQVLPGFRAGDLDATRRLALHAESVVFTPWSLLGFRMAPFTAVDVVNVNCLTCDKSNKTFYGLSAGLRTRNENLIFGTLEVKVTYVPSNAEGEPMFVFNFRQNLRIRNTGTFVKAPSLIQYN